MNSTGAQVAPRRRQAGPPASSRLGRLAARLLVATGLTVAATTAALAESRTLALEFSHTGESISIVYKRDGQYVQAGLRDLNRFLRDWRRNEATTMAPELYDLIWEVQQDFGGKTITVVSAYRSPATNAMLRSRSRGVAKHSQHMEGHAIDFYIKGVDLSKLRASGVRRQVGGVGFYPTSGSPFVHMDIGSVRAWPRMSRTELARIFPDGRTLHIPADGKPLPGYAEAQALEKDGKLASLNRGSRGGGGGGGLVALLSGGGRSRGARDADARVVTTTRAAAPTTRAAAQDGRVAPTAVATQAARPAPAQAARPDAQAPARSPQDAAPVRSAAVDGAGPFLSLPSVSLGAFIGRQQQEPAAPPTVEPVALPRQALTAVAVERAADETAAAAAAAVLAPSSAPGVAAFAAEDPVVAPVPRASPRPATVAEPASDRPATAPFATDAPDLDPVAEVLVAAASPAVVPFRNPTRSSTPTGLDALVPLATAASGAPDARDAPSLSGSADDDFVVEATPLPVLADDATFVAGAKPADLVAEAALDAAAATIAPVPRNLAYADDGATVFDDASPLSATAALIPRSALAAPLPPTRTAAALRTPAQLEVAAPGPSLGSTSLGASPSPLLVGVDTVDAVIALVPEADPQLIADSSGMSGGAFADLTRPDRNVSARDGILLASGFLGTPSSFQGDTDGWLATDHFSGTRVTVYARPRS